MTFTRKRKVSKKVKGDDDGRNVEIIIRGAKYDKDTKAFHVALAKDFECDYIINVPSTGNYRKQVPSIYAPKEGKLPKNITVKFVDIDWSEG